MAMLDILNPASEAAQPPEAVATPPKDEVELESRKAGWRDFVTRLQTDPLMQTAAMETAKQLAQGPGHGQSTWGHLVQAVQGGQQSLAMQQRNLAEAQMKGEAASKATARQAALDAQTAELQPLKKEELQASIVERRRKAEQQPEVDRLTQRLTLAQIQAAKSGGAARNPEEERLQARFNLIKKSTKGQGKQDAEIWDMVHGEQKDSNAGVGMQRITAMLNSGDQDLVDAAIGELKGSGSAPAQIPVPPGYASAEAAKAAGLIYLNGQWLRPKAK